MRTKLDGLNKLAFASKRRIFSVLWIIRHRNLTTNRWRWVYMCFNFINRDFTWSVICYEKLRIILSVELFVSWLVAPQHCSIKCTLPFNDIRWFANLSLSLNNTKFSRLCDKCLWLLIWKAVRIEYSRLYLWIEQCATFKASHWGFYTMTFSTVYFYKTPGYAYVPKSLCYWTHKPDQHYKYKRCIYNVSVISGWVDKITPEASDGFRGYKGSSGVNV